MEENTVEQSTLGEWKRGEVVEIQRPRYNPETKQIEGQVTWLIRVFSHPSYGTVYRETCPDEENGDGRDLGILAQIADLGKRKFQQIEGPEYSRQKREDYQKLLDSDPTRHSFYYPMNIFFHQDYHGINTYLHQQTLATEHKSALTSKLK